MQVDQHWTNQVADPRSPWPRLSNLTTLVAHRDACYRLKHSLFALMFLQFPQKVEWMIVGVCMTCERKYMYACSWVCANAACCSSVAEWHWAGSVHAGLANRVTSLLSTSIEHLHCMQEAQGLSLQPELSVTVTLSYLHILITLLRIHTLGSASRHKNHPDSRAIFFESLAYRLVR